VSGSHWRGRWLVVQTRGSRASTQGMRDPVSNVLHLWDSNKRSKTKQFDTSHISDRPMSPGSFMKIALPRSFSSRVVSWSSTLPRLVGRSLSLLVIALRAANKNKGEVSDMSISKKHNILTYVYMHTHTRVDQHESFVYTLEYEYMCQHVHRGERHPTHKTRQRDTQMHAKDAH